MLDLKSVAEIVTGVAAIVAAIKSWLAHDAAKEANQGITTVRAEVSNVLHLTQNLSHVQQSVTVYTGDTRGGAITDTKPIFEQEQAGGSPADKPGPKD
jgi:hypothetical protein